LLAARTASRATVIAPAELTPEPSCKRAACGALVEFGTAVSKDLFCLWAGLACEALALGNDMDLDTLLERCWKDMFMKEIFSGLDAIAGFGEGEEILATTAAAEDVAFFIASATLAARCAVSLTKLSAPRRTAATDRDPMLEVPCESFTVFGCSCSILSSAGSRIVFFLRSI